MSLESRLAALGEDAFPPTPDLAASWVGNAVPRTDRTARRRWWVAGAIVAALAVPAAVGAFELWGPDNVGLRSVERLPPAPPPAAPAGDRVPTLQQAARRAGFEPTLPPFLDAPATDVRAREGIVTFRSGNVTVTELEGRLFLGKTLGPGTDVETLTVDGAEAFFISGQPHDVVVETATGVGVLPRRRAGNTLVYERAGVVIRVEGLTAPPRSPAPGRRGSR